MIRRNMRRQIKRRKIKTIKNDDENKIRTNTNNNKNTKRNKHKMKRITNITTK